MRKARPVDMSTAERAMRFEDWVSAELVVVSRSGSEWTCVCPSCGRDKLAVNVSRRAWQCWSVACGLRGWRPTVLVAVTLGLGGSAAEAVVASWGTGADLGPQSPLEGPARGQGRFWRLPEAPQPPGMVWGWDNLPSWAIAYLTFRGVSRANAEAFGVGACLGDGSGTLADALLRSRIVVPAWDPTRRFVFWAARATTEAKAKIVNLPRPCRDDSHQDDCTCLHDKWGLPPTLGCAGSESVLPGLHLLEPGGMAIVVEGPLDAVVGGPGFVPVQGGRLSEAQAGLIAGSGVAEVVVMFDGDAAGRAGAKLAAATLEGLVAVRVAHLQDGDDPASLGEAVARRLAGEAETGEVGLRVPPRPRSGPARRPSPPVVLPLGNIRPNTT